jgi:putative DNA primase/helicase
MTDDLEKYRPQIRRFLELCGIDIKPDGTMRCISPDHNDEHPSATCYEKNVTCHVCGISWDVFDACGLVKGLGTGKSTFRERLRIVKETLGDFSGSTRAEERTNSGSKSATAFVPLPLEDAKRIYGQARKWMLSMAKKMGWGDTINGSWTCKDPEGRVEILTVRFEGGRRPKNVITFWYDGEKVQCKAPPVRLFGRDLLAASPELPVCIHEGEKCWEAAQAIPGYVAVTWSGGAKKAKQVDWGPLAGREIYYYPDDDQPGRETAQLVRKALFETAKSIRLVEPLAEAREIKSKGADIVEALQVRSPEEMAEYLRSGPELQPDGDGDAERDDGKTPPSSESISPDSFPFRILGTADDGMTYFLDRSERLQALRLGSLTKCQLQLLAPLGWWINHFRGSRGKLDVDEAVDYVIEAANGKDFDLSSLRGRGAWRERPSEENPIGAFCYHDGVHTYGSPNDDRVYQKKSRVDMGLEVAPASPETRSAMFQAASQMSFETQADCARLLAWAALAPFCGALPWRPAGFVTGGSGTGKSTILLMIVYKLAKPLRASGEGSSEAGIRQATGNDCPPVVVDEAESGTEHTHRNMVPIWGLMRQSTSDDAPAILKGTTTGKGISFATRCMYLFSAITPGLEKQADLNRFFFVDLKRPENEWPTVRTAVETVFTEENCAAVRSFVWKHVDEIVAAARAMVDAIRDVSGFDDRYALIEGMLWAAHWRVWKDRIPENAELREWLSKVYTTKAPADIEDDASMMLDRLLTEVVPVFDAPAKRYTLEHMLRAMATGHEKPAEDGMPAFPADEIDKTRYRKTCAQYGLYILRTGELSVALHRSQIAKILGSSMQYHVVLARHSLCLEKSKTVTPAGETSRKCLIFSSGVLEGEPPI